MITQLHSNKTHTALQVSDDAKKNAKPRWVRTTVNLDDHVIIPDLDPAATSADPDRALEDYVSSLSTRPMDHSRPLWDLHVIDFPTSEAAAAVAIRMHHSLGDGVSLISLSRYYFRKTGETSNDKSKPQKNIRMRSALLVNIRKTPGLHTLAQMMDPSKDNTVKWGNQIGYIVLPFRIAMHDDPLEYIRQGKKTADRKKRSLEAVFTYWSGNLVVKLLGIKAAAALCYGMFTNTTMSFSSLPGPTEKVQFYGHPIVYIATSVYGHPHALTVHFQSYMNIMKLVLAVDDEQFPDSHQLLDDFAESLRLVRQAASATS